MRPVSSHQARPLVAMPMPAAGKAGREPGTCELASRASPALSSRRVYQGLHAGVGLLHARPPPRRHMPRRPARDGDEVQEPAPGRKVRAAAASAFSAEIPVMPATAPVAAAPPSGSSSLGRTRRRRPSSNRGPPPSAGREPRAGRRHPRQRRRSRWPRRRGGVGGPSPGLGGDVPQRAMARALRPGQHVQPAWRASAGSPNRGQASPATIPSRTARLIDRVAKRKAGPQRRAASIARRSALLFGAARGESGRGRRRAPPLARASARRARDGASDPGSRRSARPGILRRSQVAASAIRRRFARESGGRTAAKALRRWRGTEPRS